MSDRETLLVLGAYVIGGTAVALQIEIGAPWWMAGGFGTLALVALVKVLGYRVLD